MARRWRSSSALIHTAQRGGITWRGGDLVPSSSTSPMWRSEDADLACRMARGDSDGTPTLEKAEMTMVCVEGV